MGKFLGDLNFIGKNMQKPVKMSKALPIIGVAALAVGGIGFMLSNIKENNDKDLGLVVEKENSKPENVKDKNKNEKLEKTSVVEVSYIEEKKYHQIETAGTTWKDIIESYYPKLIEKCDGKLYGSDGAIRKLKNALSENGNIDLVKATDIPKVLNLPLQIEGVEINSNANCAKSGITKYGGKTEIEEAGYKEISSKYKLTDLTTNQYYEHQNFRTALDSLGARTGAKSFQFKNIGNEELLNLLETGV